MTTWTTKDLEALEKGLDFYKQLKGEEANVEPIPFMGLVQLQDKEDTQQMLRKQIEIQQDIIKKLESDVKMAQDECSALIKQLGEEK